MIVSWHAIAGVFRRPGRPGLGPMRSASLGIGLGMAAPVKSKLTTLYMLFILTTDNLSINTEEQTHVEQQMPTQTRSDRRMAALAQQQDSGDISLQRLRRADMTHKIIRRCQERGRGNLSSRKRIW